MISKKVLILILMMGNLCKLMIQEPRKMTKRLLMMTNKMLLMTIEEL